MNALRSILLVASALYRIGYKLHHKFFLRPQPPLGIPVIIVGSYLAGGAGKTPFTIWLAKYLSKQGKNVAVLCHSAAWDEFIMLQREFGNAPAENLQRPPNPRCSPNHTSSASSEIKVFATKNRYATAKKIQDKFDFILCDDGFEDTRFTAAIRFCLDWQEPPTSWVSLLPAGPFRSLKQDHDDQKVIHLDCHRQNGKIKESAKTHDIRFSITSITNHSIKAPLTATIICGIGSPERFIEDIRAFGVIIEKTVIRPDHDKRFQQIVQAELLKNKDIVITLKDACRLPQTLLTHPKIHIAIQKITVSDKCLTTLDLIRDF